MWRIQLSNFRSQTGIIIVLLIWTVVYSVGLRWYYESYRPSKGSSPSNIDSNFTASTSISNNYVRDAYSKVSYASALSARELLELKSGMKVDAYFKELLKNVSTPVHKFRPKGGGPWYFPPSSQYPSTPYQPITPEDEPPPPKVVQQHPVPSSVAKEVKLFLCDDELTKRKAARIKALLERKVDKKLGQMFENCFLSTLRTTTSLLEDNSTYVITGDIDLMWIRDSSAQVNPYIRQPLVQDPLVQRIVEGLILRQLIFLRVSPYGSSFRMALRPEDHLGEFHVTKARNLYVAMHNYELDSLCYHINLVYKWWKVTGRTEMFTNEWLELAHLILSLWIVEQNHFLLSPYRYLELAYDQGLWNTPVGYTGMTWSAFRPSDDPTQFGYNIPSNMFAVVCLRQLEEILSTIYKDEQMAEVAHKLGIEIDNGIHTYGVMTHKTYGKVYAYEVNGITSSVLMDDPNVPNLLSIDYIGYKSRHDPDGIIKENTRKLILSNDNPYYVQTPFLRGYASSHTVTGWVWPMSLIMLGLTTSDPTEALKIIHQLECTDDNRQVMHESFMAEDPQYFSREWFAWADSLFAELIMKYEPQISTLNGPLDPKTPNCPWEWKPSKGIYQQFKTGVV